MQIGGRASEGLADDEDERPKGRDREQQLGGYSVKNKGDLEKKKGKGDEGERRA